MATSKKSSPLNLHDVLLMKLSVIYDVENQLIKALPKMAKAAADMELSAGFTSHLEETRGHVERLDAVFGLLDASPVKKFTSGGMEGIVDDGEWLVKNLEPGAALDAALIAAASAAEHHEISCYKAAIRWTDKLGLEGVTNLLQQNLEEEVGADNTLANLAEKKIDEAANMTAATDDDPSEV